MRRVRLGWVVGLAVCAAAVLGRGQAPGPAEAPVRPAASGPADPNRRVTAEGWFAVQHVQRPALPERVTNAFVIPIREEITDKTLDAVRRKVSRCKAKQADLVIFHMHTKGGSGEAMDGIVQLIVEDLQRIRTVSFVDSEAYSAGAIISLACNEIAITPTGKIGDAMPILVGPTGILPIPEKERDKFESAARSQIRMLAKRNGYDVALCEAMVTRDMELWLVRNDRTGELRIAVADETGEEVAQAPTRSASAPARPAGRPGLGPGPWTYVRTLDGPKELVTLTGEEAHTLGLAGLILEDMQALHRHFRISGQPTVLADTWSETLVEFLSSSGILALLVTVGLMAIYAELHTPGFGVAGTIAILCFALVFGARYLTGLANWWEIALFVVGLVLIGIEVFVTPGFGVVGIMGIACCLAGLIGILIDNPPDKLPIPRTNLGWGLLLNGLYAIGAAFLAAIAGAAVLSRYLPKVPLAGQLVLAPAEARPDSTLADDSPLRDVRPGDAGVVEHTCRPAGKVRFGEHLVDATSQGSVIEAGTRVRALGRRGNHVVVERA